MPAAERLREVMPERNARGIRIVEHWEVFATDGTGARDPNGYVPPWQGIGPQNIVGVTVPVVVGLPNYGDAHGTFGIALVASIQQVQVISNASIIVAVEYRSYGLYQGLGGQRSRAGGQDLPPEIVPVFRKITLGSGGGAFTFYRLFRGFPFNRQRMYRVEPKVLAGNQVNAIADAIQANVGRYYQIGGNFYLLSGRSSMWYDGLAYTRVEYVFDAWSSFPAIAANDPLYRNAVAIPAISNLQKWQYDTNDVDQQQPPIITVVPYSSFALPGATLPGPFP